MVYDIYSIFGFINIVVKFFICFENCIGLDEMWDCVEVGLVVVFVYNGLEYEI